MKKTILLLPFISALIFACSNPNKQLTVSSENYISDADRARYQENIVEKRRGENYVSYEYKDVRIDEIAPLAAYYCANKAEGKKAYLREIVMRENHSRLATFDCIDLQK